MKWGLNNLRLSSIKSVMNRIKIKGVQDVIYKATLKKSELFCSKIIRNIEEFEQIADVIVANRFSDS